MKKKYIRHPTSTYAWLWSNWIIASTAGLRLLVDLKSAFPKIDVNIFGVQVLRQSKFCCRNSWPFWNFRENISWSHWNFASFTVSEFHMCRRINSFFNLKRFAKINFPWVLEIYFVVLALLIPTFLVFYVFAANLVSGVFWTISYFFQKMFSEKLKIFSAFIWDRKLCPKKILVSCSKTPTYTVQSYCAGNQLAGA